MLTSGGNIICPILKGTLSVRWTTARFSSGSKNVTGQRDFLAEEKPGTEALVEEIFGGHDLEGGKISINNIGFQCCSEMGISDDMVM